jgi:hypothetical protein
VNFLKQKIKKKKKKKKTNRGIREQTIEKDRSLVTLAPGSLMNTK